MNDLTPTESRVLERLQRNPGKIVYHEELIDMLGSEINVRVHIARLRKNGGLAIGVVRNVGYFLKG